MISANAQSKSSVWGNTPEEILDRTSQHLKKQPGDPVALFHKGLAHSSLKQWSQARSIFQRLSEKHADWPEPKNNLAVALLKQGQLEKAQQSIDAAINSQPSFKVAQKNRNKIYEYLAAQAYEKALGNHKKANLPELDLLTELTLNMPVPEPRVIIKHIPQPVITKKIEPEQKNNRDDSPRVKQRLLDWAKAWSEADENHYFSSYSTNFRPSDLRKDYTQWRNIRRLRLRKYQNILVSLENIKVYFDNDKQRALAEFVQIYKSENYRDKVLKQLVLVLEKDNWLIVSEREVQKLN